MKASFGDDSTEEGDTTGEVIDVSLAGDTQVPSFDSRPKPQPSPGGLQFSSKHVHRFDWESPPISAMKVLIANHLMYEPDEPGYKAFCDQLDLHAELLVNLPGVVIWVESPRRIIVTPVRAVEFVAENLSTRGSSITEAVKAALDLAGLRPKPELLPLSTGLTELRSSLGLGGGDSRGGGRLGQ